MINEDQAKDILKFPQEKIKAKIAEEKERMFRSMQEGLKYFIDPVKRPFISKPWGWVDRICDNEFYCGKHCFIKKGKKTNLHYHDTGDKTFLVLSGRMHVVYSQDDKPENMCEMVLNSGDAFHAPPGLRHKFTGLTDTYFVEFATPFVEDDAHEDK